MPTPDSPDIPDTPQSPQVRPAVGEVQAHGAMAGRNDLLSHSPDKLAARAADNDARPSSVDLNGSRRRSTVTATRYTQDRLAAWLTLVGCLALACLPLLVNLGEPAPVQPVETMTVQTSVESWQRQRPIVDEPLSLEPLVPWLNGQPLYDTPPGVTWLHMIAFSFHEQGEVTPEELLYSARLVSVIMGLLAVGAIFWTGMSIGGTVTATLAGVVCVASPVFLFYARLAGPEVPYAGLVVLSVASAVWAIRPMRLPPSLVRQAMGWSLCGLFMGAAILTGGPEAAPFVLVPLVLIIAVCSYRLTHGLGLLAAVLIGMLVTTPWALHVLENDPLAWDRWLAAVVPDYLRQPWEVLPVAAERLGLLLAAMLPWTLWLVAALLQPFSTSSTGSRLRMFLGWLWFVPAAGMLLLAPGSGTLGEVLLVLPAGALVVGQVTRQFVDLSSEGRHARLWRVMRWPHVAALLVVSIAAPAAMHFQPWLLAEGWLDAPVTAPMHGVYWLAVGVVLTLLVLLSLRYVVRHYPGASVLVWTIWTVAIFVLVMVPVTRGPLMQPLSREGQVVSFERLSQPQSHSRWIEAR